MERHRELAAERVHADHPGDEERQLELRPEPPGGHRRRAERQEAQLQGLTDPKIVWECTLACYFDTAFEKAGDVMDGEYMSLQFLPFDEGSANPMTTNFVKYVGKDNLNGFASWGFTSGCCSSRRRKRW